MFVPCNMTCCQTYTKDCDTHCAYAQTVLENKKLKEILNSIYEEIAVLEKFEEEVAKNFGLAALLYLQPAERALDNLYEIQLKL